MHDCVGKFVEFNINFGEAESDAVVSQDLSLNSGDVWRLHCYPRGAPGDTGAGEYLSIQLENKSTARSGKVLFEATVLGRGSGEAAAAGHPPSLYRTYQHTFDHPKAPARMPLTRLIQTSELAEHCAVCGYVTIICGVVVLRHSPIPVPSSSFTGDLRGLEVQNRYGKPDVSFAVPDGKSIDVNRKVLSARSSHFKELLDKEANKLTAVEANEESCKPVTVDGEEDAGTKRVKPREQITMDSPSELQAWTFYALLVYIYCDRLPRDTECAGAPVTTELLRELLAAADKFRMDRLKLMCAKKLWEDVSVETVSKTLGYAHKHNCRELKNACMKFMTVADNSYRVMLTEEFYWLRKNLPAVIDELKQRDTTKYL